MHKPMRRLVISLIAVAMVVVAGWIVFQFVAEQNREIKLAKVKESPSVAAYNELAARLDRAREGSSAPVSQIEGQRVGESGVLPDDAEDIIAGYEQLFDHIIERQNTLGYERGIEFADILKKGIHEWTDADKSQLAEFLLANQDLIHEIRMMSQRGGPVHALDFSQGFSMGLPHLAKLRQAARLLRADAVVKAMEGNYSEVVEDVIAGMNLADALVQEPVLISQLVRIAICGSMNEALQHSAHGGELPPELVSELLSRADRADNRAAFGESFTGEQVMGLQAFAGIRSGEIDAPDLLGVGGNAGSFSNTTTLGQIAGPAFTWLYSSPLGAPWVEMDESAYADIMTRVERAGELPYYEAHPLLSQIEQDVENLPRTRIMSRNLLPALSRACMAQAGHEAHLDLMQMGLLIEQYEAQHGSYPQSLDAIAPGLGGDLPVDPFTGGEYHYRPSGDSFLLYSAGMNLSDDGGATPDYMTGDIIWRGVPER
jgi:hypothetical protein